MNRMRFNVQQWRRKSEKLWERRLKIPEIHKLPAFLVERKIWLEQLPQKFSAFIVMLSPLLQIVALYLVVKKGQCQVIPIDLTARNLVVVQWVDRSCYRLRFSQNHKEIIIEQRDNEAELLSGYVKIFPGNSEVQFRKTLNSLKLGLLSSPTKIMTL